jgi:hypothetical protein
MRQRQRVAVLLLASVAGLGACDGENLFSPPADSKRADLVPPSVEIVLPVAGAIRPPGDSVLVQARVRDDVAIDSVTFVGIARRGDAALGTHQIVSRFQPKSVRLTSLTGDTLVSRYLLPAPDSAREVVHFVVTAWDRSGNSSADTVHVTVGGPLLRIESPLPGQGVVAGLPRPLRISGRDPVGVARLEIRAEGAFQATLVRTFSPAVTAFTLDTVLVVPATATGSVTLSVRAVNLEGEEGGAAPLSLPVIPPGVGDPRPPRVRVALSALPRLEVRDEIVVRVSGSDDAGGSGVARVGFTALAISGTRGDTLVISEERVLSPARAGDVAEEFRFRPFNIDRLSLPDSVTFEVTGFMVDQAGNCGAGVREDVAEALPCVALSAGGRVVEGVSGNRLPRTVVAGRTIRLPAGGRVQDAVVDTIRRTLLLANTGRSQVDVFLLQEERFATSLGAGSQPWGLALNRRGDTLLVANSGGTDISSLYLGNRSGVGAGEDNARRLLTPDVTLWDVQRSGTGGDVSYKRTILPGVGAEGFSDRPQYLAQDSTGQLIYSTVTSPGAARGTLRRVFTPEEGTPEVDLLFGHALFQEANGYFAVANLDDLEVRSVIDAEGKPITEVILIDHLPGQRSELLRASGFGANGLLDAALELAEKGSDVFVAPGVRWDLAEVGFSDTTYVAASGDGGWVVVGEGARSPLGRIILYEAGGRRVSGVLEVSDLLTNAGERVTGVGLNHDGTLGVARGFNAYFFNPDLRLRGITPASPGGVGAALHPLHANFPSLENRRGRYEPNSHLAFIGTAEGTIEIIDTFRSRRVGTIPLRDPLTGPLRAVLPFPEDNEGLFCQDRLVSNRVERPVGYAIELYADGDGQVPHPPRGGPTDDRCIVVKLFGVTSTGGVVVVDVRKQDVLREHPARQ